MAEGKLCVVCAWREFCQKKFQISRQPGRNCPDFVRDLSIKEPEEKKELEDKKLGTTQKGS